MSSLEFTPARQAAERLVEEIRARDLAGLMPQELREHPRVQLLIEQSCSTILDPETPDAIACGTASTLVDLLQSCEAEGILFVEAAVPTHVSVGVRMVMIKLVLRAAARELDYIRSGRRN